MKIFFLVTASIEIGAGLAFLCLPSTAVVLLTGMPLETSAAVVVARIGGAGLFALGFACLLAREETPSPDARGLVIAMLLYNVAAACIITFAGISDGLHGILLWPGVLLHSAMTVWCLLCLRHRSNIPR